MEIFRNNERHEYSTVLVLHDAKFSKEALTLFGEAKLTLMNVRDTSGRQSNTF